MVDRSHDGAQTDAEDTDVFLYTDLKNINSSILKRDHCDLLLDAIDAQLGQLQVQSLKHQTISREHDCSVAAQLMWSHSLSKDTGLGSTTQTNDTPMMSFLDLLETSTVENSSDKSSGCQEDPVVIEETKDTSKTGTSDKEEIGSRREQVIWRLERLLGDTCKENGLAGKVQSPSDSICTEDFVRCFKEEMVEPSLPESDMHQLDIEDETKGIDISDSEICQTEQTGKCVFNFKRRQSAVSGKRNEATMSDPHSKSNIPLQRKEAEKCLSVSYGINVSRVSEKDGAGKRYKPPQGAFDNNSKIPVNTLDTLSIDSELDSVCTDQVKQHIYRQPVHRSTHRHVQSRSSSVNKAQHSKKETSRHGCSLGDKDTDKELNQWYRGCRTDWHALQDTAQMEEEQTTLKCVLTDSREERGSISCQLQKLQRQREDVVHEVRDMEKELIMLRQHKQTLMAGSSMERHKQNSIIVSVLEREEMERQLDNAKTELFAEQRRAREELELMQEKLEESSELLQRATEAESSIRNKCTCLEEKQMQKKEQIKTLETQVGELQVELGDCKIRLGSLEKMLAQKELQLTDFQEQCGALQAEKDELKVELQHMKTYYKTRKEAQEPNTCRMKVNQQTEEGKVNALKEQTTSLTQHIKSMQSCIQLKEEEAMKLKKSLEEQKDEAKNREVQLHVDALEKVHKAIDEERRKWEAENVEAVQVHCRILEEQNRKSLENMRSQMQREKNKALAAQHKVLKLKAKVQELESERCAHQKTETSLLAGVCKSLKEEHQAELHRLQKQMEQESQKKVLGLEQAVRLAENKSDRLRVMLEEKESSHNQITAELDQQLRAWAQELGTECQHLYLLVEQCGVKLNALHLPLSPSGAEALANLRTLREQLKYLVSHLHQKLDLQKQTSQQLIIEKERDLSIQRQQLRAERDQALGFLKERLIQDHIEELSRLHLVCKGGGVADGEDAKSLCKQLKTKDLELRQVQKNMDQWKERTAAHVASTFEEEHTTELEKNIDVHQEEQGTSEGTERGMAFNAKEPQNSTFSSSLRAMYSAASYSPSDVASFKLLSYLQSKVKQLRVENQAYTCSPTPSDSVPLDWPESHFTRITQGQDSAGTQSQPSTSALSS